MKSTFTKFFYMVKRNIKMYFSDKMVFFTSLLAPLILLLLFVLFLRKLYAGSFASILPQGFEFATANLSSGFVAGYLISSLMSVTCITVSIGAGVIMVGDKLTGAINDFKTAPIKGNIISLSYLVATFVSAIIIVFSVLTLGFLYIAIAGWHLSAADVLLIILNTFLLTVFGCGLSVVINSFINSEAGLTAASAGFSSTYGFICGSYMPLSQFGTAFSNIFGFNPGLHATILFKKLFMRGCVDKMTELPPVVIDSIKDGFDMNYYFFGKNLPPSVLWAVVGGGIVVVALIIVVLSNKNSIKKLFVRTKKA